MTSLNAEGFGTKPSSSLLLSELQLQGCARRALRFECFNFGMSATAWPLIVSPNTMPQCMNRIVMGSSWASTTFSQRQVFLMAHIIFPALSATLDHRRTARVGRLSHSMRTQRTNFAAIQLCFIELFLLRCRFMWSPGTRKRWTFCQLYASFSVFLCLRQSTGDP